MVVTNSTSSKPFYKLLYMESILMLLQGKASSYRYNASFEVIKQKDFHGLWDILWSHYFDWYITISKYSRLYCQITETNTYIVSPINLMLRSTHWHGWIWGKRNMYGCPTKKGEWDIYKKWNGVVIVSRKWERPLK